MDVAGGFDTDGAGGSGLDGFGFFGDSEGCGADAEEREGCEGEHGVVVWEGDGEYVYCLSGGILELRRGKRTLESDSGCIECFL